MRTRSPNILDRYFSTWGHIVVLRALSNARTPRSGRACARLTGMTHRAAIQSLERLVVLGIAQKEQKGRSLLYSLSKDHRFNRAMLPLLLEYEQSYLPSAVKLIRKYLSPFAESVILHQPVEISDPSIPITLRICVIAKDSPSIRPSLDLLAEHLRRSLGILLERVILTPSHFRLSEEQKSPDIKPFIKEGTVVTGKTLRELLL